MTVTQLPESPQPRHRDGRRGSGIATWVWVTPLALLLVLGLVLGWLALSRGEDADPGEDCFAGDLTLVIWADPAAEQKAGEIAANYAATAPVVRDYCVRPQVVVKTTEDAAAAYGAGELESAAVWLPVGLDALTGLPGAPEDPPVVAETSGGQPVPLVVLGSSPTVTETTARAGADLLRSIVG